MQQAPTYGAVPSATDQARKSQSDEQRLQDACDEGAVAQLLDFEEESPTGGAALRARLLHMARCGTLLDSGQIDSTKMATMIAKVKADAVRAKANAAAAARRRRGFDSDSEESDSDLF